MRYWAVSRFVASVGNYKRNLTSFVALLVLFLSALGWFGWAFVQTLVPPG